MPSREQPFRYIDRCPHLVGRVIQLVPPSAGPPAGSGGRKGGVRKDLRPGSSER